MFHFLAILTGLVEVLALSGLLYGWPAISEIFKREKVYEELCPQHSNGTCLEQDQAFVSNIICKLSAQFFFNLCTNEFLGL